ncbi:MAG: helix-turn-helix transcriptional regulator [Deltaproteobacteria bacterium]|nr:helix-turn-helix transcriptional regulator [Deltaproteobacteria bacterium]
MGVGLNRSQFQRALGVAYSTVLMWERDRTHPNADNLRLISEITGEPVDALLRPLETDSEAQGSPQRAARHYPEVLTRFLAGPLGRDVTDFERRTLESVLYHHMKPTEEALEKLLEGLRDCEKTR